MKLPQNSGNDPQQIKVNHNHYSSHIWKVQILKTVK